MITESTALLLAHLHRERDATVSLLAECEKEKDRDNALWERSFGSPNDRPNLTKGRYIEVRIPSGGFDSNAYMPRLVNPALGLSILRAHLAEVQAKIVTANEMARLELDTASSEVAP